MKNAEYENSLDWLYRLQFLGTKLGLDNTKALLAGLGNPEKKLRVIHVAGTNGKGSVCAIVSSILREAGYKVGTYASPHLKEFGERISINGYPMSHDEFVRAIKRIRPKVEELAHLEKSVNCTFFETTTAMALDHFARRKVDFAVIEVGMGGRLDSTNIVRPEICAITSIDLEHTEHLGDTLAEIAGEKVGIVKTGVPVVVGELPPEALAVVKKIAKSRRAPVIIAPEIEAARDDAFGFYLDHDGGVAGKAGGGRRFNLAGEHQLDNLAVALSLIDSLDADVPREAIDLGLENVRWPGRLQWARLDPPVLLDSAHNPAGAAALRKFVCKHLAAKKIVGVVGMIKTKDAGGFAAEIGPVFDEVVVTQPTYDKRLDADELAGHFSGEVETCQSVEKALKSAMKKAGKDGVVLVTGSIFLVSDAVAVLDRMRISEMFKLLKAEYPIGAFPGKEVGGNETTLGKRQGDAFDVLISTILSQRTRDENTHLASTQLFSVYPTPEALANADMSRVEELIRPAGFYRQKAGKIVATARAIVDRHGAVVPKDVDELLALPGVGRKTANCVLVYGHNIPAMPVDTHVHRISNLLGLINTPDPDASEAALVNLIPKKYWIDINRLLVRHGQVVCIPVRPRCEVCFISHLCDAGICRNMVLFQ